MCVCAYVNTDKQPTCQPVSQSSKQASKKASKQASKQDIKQASKQASKQATKTLYLYINISDTRHTCTYMCIRTVISMLMCSIISLCRIYLECMCACVRAWVCVCVRFIPLCILPRDRFDNSFNVFSSRLLVATNPRIRAARL